MTDSQGTWGEVAIDTTIRDKDGVAWRVCTIDDEGHLLLKNRHNVLATVTPRPPAEPVEIVPPDDEDACIILLRDRLKAEVFAVKPEGSDLWVLESWGAKAAGGLDKYREHLFDFHGVYAKDITGNGAYKRLLAAHIAAHDEAQPRIGSNPIPHTHPYVHQEAT